MKTQVYGGFSPEEARKQGIRLRVDARLEARAGTFLAAGREQRRLKSALKAFELAPPQGVFPKQTLETLSRPGPEGWCWQQWEYGDPPEECTAFAWVESEQYPEPGDYYRERARRWRVERERAQDRGGAS